MRKKIKVKYHGIDEIMVIKEGDWIDLRTAESVGLSQGEYQEISLGVSIQLPKGYEAIVAPRSSTFKKFGILLANSIGIIDESYCGNDDIWKFPAYAVADTFIPKGTRICQFRIVKHQPKLSFISCKTLDGPNRGGIGSTDTIYH